MSYPWNKTEVAHQSWKVVAEDYRQSLEIKK